MMSARIPPPPSRPPLPVHCLRHLVVLLDGVVYEVVEQVRHDARYDLLELAGKVGVGRHAEGAVEARDVRGGGGDQRRAAVERHQAAVRAHLNRRDLAVVVLPVDGERREREAPQRRPVDAEALRPRGDARPSDVAREPRGVPSPEHELAPKPGRVDCLGVGVDDGLRIEPQPKHRRLDDPLRVRGRHRQLRGHRRCVVRAVEAKADQAVVG